VSRRTYTGTAVDVSFDAEVCEHAAACVRGLPEVFDTKRRPWIAPDAAAPDAVVEVVGRCPSGALRIERGGDAPPEVVRVDAAERYELRVDGAVLGYAEFRPAGEGRVILPHTVVEEGHEGKGLGATLARGTLDDLRARGTQVIPTCPFIAAFIQRHPEYDDLVVPALRPRRTS
jgi:uncharacterized protein